MRMRSRFMATALVIAFSLGSAVCTQAMPSDVGGTWNAEPQYVSQPQNPYWDGYVAHWNGAINAEKYEIQLHRNGAVASTDTTANTHISYKTLLQQSGEYTFRVRAISIDGYASDWSVYSENHHVSGYDANRHNSATYEPSQGPGANPYSPGTVKYGWTRSNDGYFWLWKDNNGSYAKNTFRTIDGNMYYFDSNGYMFTGWMALNNTTYYFFGNGIMAVGNQEIDGRIYHFSDQPGPNYGAQTR